MIEFASIFSEFRLRNALSINGVDYTYKQLDLASRSIAANLDGSLIGILAGRSFETFAAVVASIRTGRTYVPLSSESPDRALVEQLADAALDVLIVDETTAARAERVLGSLQSPVAVLCPAAVRMEISPPHRRIPLGDGRDPIVDDIDRTSAADLYRIFTSGTTGRPKLIPISRQSVAAYLGEIAHAFDFRHSDRFSQFFNLSFDLSVHDMGVSWSSGGCLCVPTGAQYLDLVRFANESRLTVWFSGPSHVRLAMMAKRLAPDALPTVRHALFCGETLPWEIATPFSKAAPNAALTNLYGPTEATIAITRHHFDPRVADDPSRQETSVPIGTPFRAQEAAVVDTDFRPVREGEIGELVLGGSQLARGYCNNAAETSARFLPTRIDGFASRRWYKTGDLVKYEHGALLYVGRDDMQIKLRGHRVELSEIEAALARAAGSPLAIVMPSHDPTGHMIDGLVAFIVAPHEPPEAIYRTLHDRLPRHKVPKALITIPSDMNWQNANGKVDRQKIRRWYEEQQGMTDGRRS